MPQAHKHSAQWKSSVEALKASLAEVMEAAQKRERKLTLSTYSQLDELAGQLSREKEQQVSLLRLTAVEIAKVGNEVTQAMFGLAGTTAIYSNHPLQRYLRDAAVVKQHAFLGEGIYDGAGAVEGDGSGMVQVQAAEEAGP